MSALFKSELPEIDWAAARRAADAPIEDISASGGRHLIISVAIVAAGVLADFILS